jgi:hypothetical protein
MRLDTPSVRWLVCLVLASCWIASIFTPAVVTEDGQIQQGYAILIGGWFGPAMFQFAWFANPLFLAVLLRVAIGNPSRLWLVISAGLLALLAINALFWNFILWEGKIERYQIGGIMSATLVARAEED